MQSLFLSQRLKRWGDAYGDCWSTVHGERSFLSVHSARVSHGPTVCQTSVGSCWGGVPHVSESYLRRQRRKEAAHEQSHIHLFVQPTLAAHLLSASPWAGEAEMNRGPVL